MAGKFVLQIVGVTESKIINYPSAKPASKFAYILSDVMLIKENKEVLTYTPCYGCDGLSDTDAIVLIAPYPPDGDEHLLTTDNGEKFTHAVFLAVYNEFDENEQIIAINPNIAMELMESAIEKKLMRCLPPVKQFKRNVHMQLEGKVDSVYSFVGLCTDNVPFIMEVNNVPFAEYNHGQPNASKISLVKLTESEYNSKTAYFPEKNNPHIDELIKRINELGNIAKESNVRCIISFVIERTDIEKFEISQYSREYKAAIKKAVECGVYLMPIVFSWTKEGVAFFVTDEIQIA
jgi:DNA-binding sugar fermentation-stimulating protein